MRSRYDFICQQLSNCDVIDMRAASYCDVTLIYYSDTVSMGAFIITMALPDREFRHGGSSSWSSRDLSLCIASFRGRIEIDHSYGLRCRDLCCHSWHSTREAGHCTELVKWSNILCYEMIVAYYKTLLHKSCAPGWELHALKNSPWAWPILL